MRTVLKTCGAFVLLVALSICLGALMPRWRVNWNRNGWHWPEFYKVSKPSTVIFRGPIDYAEPAEWFFATNGTVQRMVLTNIAEGMEIEISVTNWPSSVSNVGWFKQSKLQSKTN